MRYDVFSLDMWGHVPADCCEAYDCPCVRRTLDDEATGDLEHEHDDNACECHEECNAQYRVGEIEVPEGASDDAILDTLHAEGFLTDFGRKMATLDDYSDGPLDVNDDAGRRLFHLMPDDAT